MRLLVFFFFQQTISIWLLQLLKPTFRQMYKTVNDAKQHSKCEISITVTGQSIFMSVISLCLTLLTVLEKRMFSLYCEWKVVLASCGTQSIFNSQLGDLKGSDRETDTFIARERKENSISISLSSINITFSWHINLCLLLLFAFWYSPIYIMLSFPCLLHPCCAVQLQTSKI